jgi:pterin-4a-carbinolamine dehydratase
MNKLATLAQIKTYKPKELSSATHAALRGTLKHFLPDPTITALTYTYSFPAHSLPFLHEKMTRIGTIADEIDHHPEWTLREGEL